MNLEQARFNMIEQQIRPWNVSDTEVLRLLSLVKREDFVPLAYQALAFVEQETPLGYGQCMLSPCSEARMLQDAAVHKHEKVLEIGTGSGYMTALLAHRAQQVLSLEINPELIKMADASIKEVCGVSHKLPSGPLHDAAEVCRAGVPTVMLFVQSLYGISHNKIEDTKEEHIEMSVAALDAMATKTMAWILG